MTSLDDSQRPEGFDCVHLLLVTPTGVLSDLSRRKWRESRNIIVDTFDGAFDTEESYESPSYTLGRHDDFSDTETVEETSGWRCSTIQAT